MYQVYAIYNRLNDKIYIGQTDNLDGRLKQHNDKLFHKSYTSKFDGDWRLVYREDCNTRFTALKREKQLKSYQGRQFIKKLVNNYSPVAQR